MSESRRGYMVEKFLRGIQAGIPGRNAELWDSAHPGDKWLTNRAEWLVKSLGIKELLDEKNKKKNGVTVLDIGAGKGHLMDEIDQQLPGAHVVGLDPHDHHTAIVEKRAKTLGNDIKYLDEQQRAENMPGVSNGSVDAAVLSFVLHHLTENECKSMFIELQRVLVDDGYIFVAEDVVDTEEEKNIAKSNDRLLNTEVVERSPHRYYSMQKWKDIFEQNGFRLIQSHEEQPDKVKHCFLVFKKQTHEQTTV